jgi:hypothetical protein
MRIIRKLGVVRFLKGIGKLIPNLRNLRLNIMKFVTLLLCLIYNSNYPILIQLFQFLN